LKNFITVLLGLLLIVSLSSCGSSADPQFRVSNQSINKANVQIQTSGGNTINLNVVDAGQTTTYQSVAEGNTKVTAVIQNQSVSPTTSFFAYKDGKYTIVILDGTPPTLRVDQQ
jgi:protein-disulfide isomerase